jgi:hypothetical protein
MDPAHIMETANQLRGLGVQNKLGGQVLPVPTCPHIRPEVVSETWRSCSKERPKAARNPALGADYVIDGIRAHPPGTMSESIVDARDPREIIGVSSRMDARFICRK